MKLSLMNDMCEEVGRRPLRGLEEFPHAVADLRSFFLDRRVFRVLYAIDVFLAFGFAGAFA